jgi:hypothetical protein
MPEPTDSANETICLLMVWIAPLLMMRSRLLIFFPEFSGFPELCTVF